MLAMKPFCRIMEEVPCRRVISLLKLLLVCFGQAITGIFWTHLLDITPHWRVQHWANAIHPKHFHGDGWMGCFRSQKASNTNNFVRLVLPDAVKIKPAWKSAPVYLSVYILIATLRAVLRLIVMWTLGTNMSSVNNRNETCRCTNTSSAAGIPIWTICLIAILIASIICLTLGSLWRNVNLQRKTHDVDDQAHAQAVIRKPVEIRKNRIDDK